MVHGQGCQRLRDSSPTFFICSEETFNLFPNINFILVDLIFLLVLGKTHGSLEFSKVKCSITISVVLFHIFYQLSLLNMKIISCRMYENENKKCKANKKCEAIKKCEAKKKCEVNKKCEAGEKCEANQKCKADKKW